MEQFANAGRAVLWLLHGEPDQVVLPRVYASRTAGRDLARQIARVEFDRFLATSYRQPDAKPLGIDQVRLRRKADKMDRVAAKQHFRSQKRSVGRAHDQDFIGCHNVLPDLARSASALGKGLKGASPGSFGQDAFN